MKYLLLGLFFFVSVYACRRNNPDAEVRVDPVPNPVDSLDRKPPIANAGPDQNIVLPKTWVIIDGSSSIAPNSKPLFYKWKKLAGPDHVQYYPSFYQNPQPAQIEMDLFGAGEYLFELTVSNSSGLSAADVVKITVINGPETAHPIDMVFSVNSFCGISGNFPSTVYYSEAYFILKAASPSGFSGANISADVRVEQAYEKYAQDYFSPPLLRLSEGSSGLINFQFYSHLNFFKLPYNGSSASFADSVFVTSGMGRFANVKHGTRIYCTGTADTLNHTSNVRLQGTLYY